MIRVTVWNEFKHETTDPEIISIYPKGMHEVIADYLRQEEDLQVRCAWLAQPEHGLTKEVLAETDVLTWWGHTGHDEVQDEIVSRVQQRVLEGMGLIVLHSGHFSKIFKRMLGTSCGLRWRDIGEKERLWVMNPAHPIAAGLPAYIELPQEEMYGEAFDIPAPDDLVFVSWFAGGEVFRSGCCWYRGKGRVFYFRPGHEAYPIYYNPQIMQVIGNAVRWANFQGNANAFEVLGEECPPIEPIGKK